MAARILIAEGMTPAEFISALNNNFGRVKYKLTAPEFTVGMDDYIDTINIGFAAIDTEFSTNNNIISHGYSGSSLISNLNNNFIQSEIPQKTQWISDVKADHKTINSHIPDADYNLYYVPLLDEILASDYIDDDAVGYYYETYGPPGLARETANFLILLFFDDDLTSGIYTVLTGGTYRQNIEGEITNCGTVPNHAYIGNGKWIISCSDWSTTTSVRLSNCKLIYYPPSFYYLPSSFELMLGTNKLEGNYTVYDDNTKIHNGLYYLYNNYFTGEAPRIIPGDEYGIYYISDNFFTSIDIVNSTISTNLHHLYIQNNRINTASLDALFTKLNTFFTGTPPLYDLTIDCTGGGMGTVTGVLTEGVWLENADIVGLKAAFISAGKTLTLTYNSDETFGLYTFDEKIVILTIDDSVNSDLTDGKPILDKYNIKPTVFVIGSFIGTTGYLSGVQLKTLQDEGWDIQCHGYTHAVETTLTEAQLRTEMTNSSNAFATNNLNSPTIHAYPTYKNNASVQSIVAEYRDIARAGNGGFGTWSYIYKNANTMELTACFADVRTRLNLLTLKQEADAAVDKGGVLILSLHSPQFNYGYDPDLLDELLDYIVNTKGFTIMTMEEFWTEYGYEFV
jgi:peptidoglycan/xylan/chitin deacetylase (PgdA/CDA1 family)